MIIHKTVTVYRVEHRDGHHGPFYTAGAARWHIADFSRELEDWEYDSADMPPPYSDGMSHMGRSHLNWEGFRFGCRTLALVKEWFCDIGRERLAEQGFLIGIYEATQAEHGELQTAFHYDTATRIGEEELCNI